MTDNKIVSIEDASNNVKEAVAAIKLTEESFKIRLEQRGLTKESAGYKTFQREYNNALDLRTELVNKGIEGGKGSIKLNYANPEKHKSKVMGTVNPESRLFKAMEIIRTERIESFIRSRKETLLPNEAGLTDKQWCEVALALHMVPMKYRKPTKTGGLANNKDTAELFLTDHKQEVLDKMAEFREEFGVEPVAPLNEKKKKEKKTA